MEVYARKPVAARPLVCLDEFSKQLLSEVAAPLQATPQDEGKPGRRKREEAEYVREGSASAFMIAAPHLGLRQVYVGEKGQRTTREYAEAVELLCDGMFPEAEKIVLVQDNLNTHNAASLYKIFPPEKARRLAEKIEWHYTPKHGSWLNIAECEISVLARAALHGRIGSLKEFEEAVEKNTEKRNADPRPVKWQFTTADARVKLKHLYPKV